MTESNHNAESRLMSYLVATAEQLDIAAEDVDIALDEVLETFEAAANCMEVLEAAMEDAEGMDKETLLEVVTSMRKMLKASVVSLQFEDRLLQRLGLAARELRQVVADNSGGELEFPQIDLKVPRSVSSLYSPQQMVRILKAAGDKEDLFQGATLPAEEDDSIELF